MRRLLPMFLAALLAAPVAARSADSRVELKNADSMSVSVPLGTDNGVTKESDFEAVASDHGTVFLYPFELFGNMFWSQPLSAGSFSRLVPGAVVRPAVRSIEDHRAARRAGDARKAELKERKEEERREAARKEEAELREGKARLAARVDEMNERIAAAENALADEEGRADWITSSEDRDIDRALQNIQEYGDRRDELQEQRNALAGQRPYPSAEAGRLSAEIKRLNDRIASERDTIRTARDRKRSARSTYLSRKQDWQKLVAERNRLAGEIRSIDRKIRELSGK
ncbi:MAG: hypothetical protein HZB86_09620 [Deltaproteobacteria bacterium]|nr:hypothetical protein [Deltaproteobacteria bacterium]